MHTDPRVLLLDRAISSVDTRIEKGIQEARLRSMESAECEWGGATRAKAVHFGIQSRSRPCKEMWDEKSGESFVQAKVRVVNLGYPGLVQRSRPGHRLP